MKLKIGLVECSTRVKGVQWGIYLRVHTDAWVVMGVLVPWIELGRDGVVSEQMILGLTNPATGISPTALTCLVLE